METCLQLHTTMTTLAVFIRRKRSSSTLLEMPLGLRVKCRGMKESIPLPSRLRESCKLLQRPETSCGALWAWSGLVCSNLCHFKIRKCTAYRRCDNKNSRYGALPPKQFRDTGTDAISCRAN